MNPEPEIERGQHKFEQRIGGHEAEGGRRLVLRSHEARPEHARRCKPLSILMMLWQEARD